MNKRNLINRLLHTVLLVFLALSLGFSQANDPILIIGGSQSAKIFGEEIPKVIKKCHDEGILFNLFQQCLDNQKNNLQNIYKNLNINFELFSFTKDLSEFYKKSDLVITRCGASSIAELVNLKIPSTISSM